jgi:hypothetical protein
MRLGLIKTSNSSITSANVIDRGMPVNAMYAPHQSLFTPSVGASNVNRVHRLALAPPMQQGVPHAPTQMAALGPYPSYA